MSCLVGNLGEADVKNPVSIEIYSDVVCPWCYIGKRRVEQALERIREQYVATMPVWRAFQLNPDLPAEGVARKDYVEQKFGGAQRAKEIYARVASAGASVDIPFEFERIARQPNTINAHRLIRYAGVHNAQDAAVEALFRTFFLDARDIGDLETLANVAAESGLNRDATQRYLQSEEGADEVRSEDAMARQLGIAGVPFFVFAGKYAVSGAQEADVLVQAYEQAASETSNVSVVDA